MTQQEKKELLEWPSEDRIDTVGQNGNDGEHYAVLDEQSNDAKNDNN